MKSRGFCFTWNNFTSDSVVAVEKVMKSARYGIFGSEVGEKGTPHLQGYVYFDNARSFEALRKKMIGAHIEIAKGSPDQNREYCSKGGKFLEFGVIPKQGTRRDLAAVAEDVKNGLKVDTICINEPMMFHQYGRTLNKIEDLMARKKFRTEMTKGIWYWGSTGTGKSHKAFEGFTPETHYVVPNDNGWWDGYTQQKIVILNDFRGEIPYNMMLQLVDKWPMVVRRRNREPMPFTSEIVIVTSSLPPAQLFNRRADEDDIAQLLRRFVIECLDTEVVEGNNKTSTFDFLSNQG